MANTGISSAETWKTDNKMSRIVVHAFCGDPIANEAILDEFRCFCGRQFAADESESSSTKSCGGKKVPNYESSSLLTSEVLKQLFLILYGDKHKGDRWCTEFDGKDCKNEKKIEGLLGQHNEVLVVGHLVAAIVGEDNCIKASASDEGSWYEDTALKDLDLDVLQIDGLQAEFERGCRIDYNKVWEWKKE